MTGSLALNGRRDVARAKPPQATWSLINEEAEQALLGALMIDNRVFDAVGDRLSPDDFGIALHADIYRAIVVAIASGKPATPVALSTQFHEDPRGPQGMSVREYLADMAFGTTAVFGAADFATQIRDLARRRTFIVALDELRDRASTDAYGSLLEALDAPMATALEDDREAKPIWSVGQLFDHTVNRVEDEAAGRVAAGVRTETLPDFNDLVGGAMRKGDVTILAGRPGMGKTALALAIGNGAAAAGHGTLFISLEMDAESLGARLVADTVFDFGNSPKFESIKRGRFGREDRAMLREAGKRIAGRPLTIVDPSSLKAGSLSMLVRRHKRLMEARGQKLELVVIDYLQLVQSDRKREKIYEEVTDVSRVLKPLAKECEVAVLALAQVSRRVEEREDKRPMLSDLRDSGHIEQDADNVVFIYREEYYLQQREPDASQVEKHVKWQTSIEQVRDRLEIYSAKVRNGATTRRLSYFFGEYQAVRSAHYFRDRGLGV